MRLYLAMRVSRLPWKLQSLSGVDVVLETSPNGVIGYVPVFESLEKAEAYYGDDTEIIEIEVGDVEPEESRPFTR